LKLEKIATDIGKLGMYCGLLTIHILYLRFFIEKFLNRTMDCFGSELQDPHGHYNGLLKYYVEEWI